MPFLYLREVLKDNLVKGKVRTPPRCLVSIVPCVRKGLIFLPRLSYGQLTSPYKPIFLLLPAFLGGFLNLSLESFFHSRSVMAEAKVRCCLIERRQSTNRRVKNYPLRHFGSNDGVLVSLIMLPVLHRLTC